jgi:hypothetical protein
MPSDILSDERADCRYCDTAFGEEDSERNIHQILRPASAMSMRKIPEPGRNNPNESLPVNRSKAQGYKPRQVLRSSGKR